MSNSKRHPPLLPPLESAIQNALLVFWATFVTGIAVGWGLAQWSRAPIGAVLGLLIGALAVAWIGWAFRKSSGSLANPEKDTIQLPSERPHRGKSE